MAIYLYSEDFADRFNESQGLPKSTLVDLSDTTTWMTEFIALFVGNPVEAHDMSEADFYNNGYGTLPDAIIAYAEEELNGLFEFYMEYDSEGALVDELKEERIIKAPAQDKLGEQLFRIYSVTKSHDNDCVIVKAQHITYDLANNYVEEYVANNLTKKQAMEKIGSSTVRPHPFVLTSTNTTTRSSTRLYRTNPLQMVAGMSGSILQIWGGQIERDNFRLILHDRRGSDDGVAVTYEKNITGLEATIDISGLVTRIHPFVKIEASDGAPERLIELPGKYIDSPLINAYSQVYIEPLDLSQDERIDVDGKTDAQIRQQIQAVAERYFDETGNDKPKATMDVEFAHLWETEEYKDVAPLELVGMGDTVTVRHSKLGVEATAIVNYIRYNCLAGVNEEVKLGGAKARMSDAISRIERVEERVNEVQDDANRAIVSANGKNTTFYGPDEPDVNAIKGDTWFKVVDGEYTRTYRYDGIEWQLIVDMDSAEAKQEAQQAKDRADDAVNRANQATQQATNAIDQAQTAFDEAQTALTTVTGLQGDVTNLSTLVDNHTGQISSLTQTTSGLQSSVTNLQDELDGLEIGGRNLLRNSDFREGGASWHAFNNTPSNLIYVEDGNLFVDGSSGTSAFGQSIPDAEAGKNYVFSFRARGNGSIRVRWGTKPNSEYVNVTDVFQYYSLPAVDKGSNNHNLIIEVVNGIVEFDRVKLEKGNKATDWTPAPEDIDYQFSVITQTIDSITTRVGDAEGNITALQQTSSSLAGRLTDAEGNLTTLTATVDGLQTTVSDVQGNVSNLTQLSTTLQIRLSDAEDNINTLTLTSQSLVSKIENIGGSNLNRDSNNFSYGVWTKYDGGSYTVTENVSVEEWGATDATRVRAAEGNGTSVLKILKNITSTTDTVEGETYTISFYVKNMRDREMSVNINGILPRPTVNIGANEAKRVVVTGERSTANLQLQFRSFGNGYYTEFIVWRAQVEKGEVATDWQPAYEDTYSQITQLSDAINLRVTKGDVINQINLDTSGVLISGKKLILDGDTTVLGTFKLDGSAHIKDASIGTAQIGTIDAAIANIINLSANSIVGGILSSQNSTTTFNLNTGELHMENADIVIGNGAMIRLTDRGNKMQFDEMLGGTRRYSGVGLGRGVNERPYPIAYLGTSAASGGSLNNTDSSWSGITVVARRAMNEGGRSTLTGQRWGIRSDITDDKGVYFNFDVNNPSIRTLNPTSYDYTIGTFRTILGLMRLDILNYHNEKSGWQLQTTYTGTGAAIMFYGLSGNDYNYQIGGASTRNRIQNIYLKNQPNVNSDVRLKEDISDLEIGLNFIKRIETKQFRLKLTNADINQGITQNPIQYGIIAQQVNSVLADFGVSDNSLITQSDDGYYGAQYEQFIAPLIKSVQELDTKLNDEVSFLKLKIQYLEQEIKLLKGVA